ncbi:hypothetical protein [uncultured Campylobacter sp.]|uniref:hypothetical protein n=1 Tax=uncultured Campylobacter sp. TaxID=218934 RepID=UPI0026209170|nr:hypothetical protein [uncultured Campylobacter sp.]
MQETTSAPFYRRPRPYRAALSPKAHAITNFAIEPHRTAGKLARQKYKFTL